MNVPQVISADAREPIGQLGISMAVTTGRWVGYAHSVISGGAALQVIALPIPSKILAPVNIPKL